jgi:LmbE family N-acetylglucosaminyl deacetylase
MLPGLIYGLLAPLAAIALTTVVVFLVARRRLNDMSTPIARNLEAFGTPENVLAVWAHPDDEITSAGTLAGMARAGVKVTLLYLTHGEAARDTGYSREELAKVRAEEAKAAAKTLGAAHVKLLELPDGGLTGLDPAAAKAAIRAAIDHHRPQVVISFDEQVGYYGHPDHIQTGRWVREVIEAGAVDPDFPVRRLYQATLPLALIGLARKLVAAFRDHYPTDPAKGLPVPTLAVPIAAQATTKRALLDVHRSQAKVIADVQPYYDRAPAWLYYRLFDREYFSLAWSRD